MVVLTWYSVDNADFFFGVEYYYRGKGPSNGYGVGYATGRGRSGGFRDGDGVGCYPHYAIIGVSTHGSTNLV